MFEHCLPPILLHHRKWPLPPSGRHQQHV